MYLGAEVEKPSGNYIPSFFVTKFSAPVMDERVQKGVVFQ
jgi:hypothetical protein